MSGAEKTAQQSAPHPESRPLLKRTRTAQRAGGNRNSLTINLTTEGVDIHGIAYKDELVIEIYENGFWISTTETDHE